MSHHAVWFSLLSPSSTPRKTNITLSNLNQAAVFNTRLKPSLSKGRNRVGFVTSTSHQALGRCCCSTGPTLSPGPGFSPENHPRSFSHPSAPAMLLPNASLDTHADPKPSTPMPRSSVHNPAAKGEPGENPAPFLTAALAKETETSPASQTDAVLGAHAAE